MFVTREKSDNDRKPTLPVRVYVCNTGKLGFHFRSTLQVAVCGSV